MPDTRSSSRYAREALIAHGYKILAVIEAGGGTIASRKMGPDLKYGATIKYKTYLMNGCTREICYPE